ncbi:hypothetical protein LQW54_000772 [Pestalotiopsis sp. IQ-011]
MRSARLSPPFPGTTNPTGTITGDDDKEESLFVPEDKDAPIDNTDSGTRPVGNKTNGTDDDDEFVIKTENISDDDDSGASQFPGIGGWLEKGDLERFRNAVRIIIQAQLSVHLFLHDIGPPCD